MPNIENEIFYIIGSIMTILVNFPGIIEQINFNLKFNRSLKRNKILWF